MRFPRITWLPTPATFTAAGLVVVVAGTVLTAVEGRPAALALTDRPVAAGAGPASRVGHPARGHVLREADHAPARALASAAPVPPAAAPAPAPVSPAAPLTQVAAPSASSAPATLSHRRTAAAARLATSGEQSRVAAAPDASLRRAILSRLATATSSRYSAVVDVAGRGRVVDINGGAWMRPASTEKLFTTLPLLLRAPDARLVTAIAATAKPRGGIVHGDLVVRAAADPSLQPGDLTSLASQVRRHGIRTVTGRLLLDIGTLPLRTRRLGWKPEWVPEELGPLSPFPVAGDWLRTTQWYLWHPTAGNLALLRHDLSSAGVRIRGGSGVQRGVPASYPVASHGSATVAALIAHTLQESDNFYAETLLSRLGGQQPVHRVATAAGADTGRFVDGSGLSSYDRRTAAGEVALLHYAHRSAVRPQFVSALALACRRGTLKDRLCGTAASGLVWAKTGTLNHTRTLAGYTYDARGRLVTFSVMCNDVSNISAASAAVDQVMLVLRGYSG